ncbi:response regulator [Desulfobacterales bacterium HSG17]|nr:response regulator [Desulfobacterales bacterium HSG17]
MKKLKLLLIDDDPLILKGMGSYLKKKGFQMTTAGSGEKAVELLDKSAFDLVITDLVMEQVNGIRVLQKSKEVNPETMNIILTGHGNLDSAINALKLGADDYILKPCNTEEMLSRISACFEKLELKRKIKLTKLALQESDEKLLIFKTIIESSEEAIAISEPGGQLI